jgi:hypothetical protein
VRLRGFVLIKTLYSQYYVLPVSPFSSPRGGGRG